MCPDGECFLDTCATRATVLCRIGWLDADHRDGMDCPIVGEPQDKAAPGGIADRLCQFPIFDEIGYAQCLESNQIVRGDKRVRRFSGEILALPTDFEIAFGELFAGLLAIS